MCGTEILKRLEDFCFWFLLGSKRQEKSAWYLRKLIRMGTLWPRAWLSSDSGFLPSPLNKNGSHNPELVIMLSVLYKHWDATVKTIDREENSRWLTLQCIRNFSYAESKISSRIRNEPFCWRCVNTIRHYKLLATFGYWNDHTGQDIRATKLFLTKSYIVCNLFIIYSVTRDN